MNSDRREEPPGAGADLSWHFAHLAANSAYSDLPFGAVDAVKKSILDTLGVCIAGSGLEPAARAVVDVVEEGGGRREATVLGFGGRVPAPMAAFANGALAHALDYDDLTPWGQHSGSSIVPAVLAVAERHGAVSGRDLIAAVAVGQDMFARMRRHVAWRKDWNLGSAFGVYAATAASARVLQLSTRQTQSALGIATQQSSGVMEVVAGVGGDFRGMYAGFSAKGAVLATMLAQKGMTCVGSPFEGQYGIFNTYFRGEYEREGMLDQIGADFQGSSTLYKRWPAVGTSHSHIHAVLGLMRAYDIDVDHIAEIRVFVGDYHSLMCSPLDLRRAPQTLMDARFSLPFLVAAAAVRRQLSVWDFTMPGLQDPAVRAVAERVVPIPDSQLDWKMELPPGRVEIVIRDGHTYSATGTEVPGTPEAPMSWGQIQDKFQECASASAVPLAEGKIGAVIDLTARLEELDDVNLIVRSLW